MVVGSGDLTKRYGIEAINISNPMGYMEYDLSYHLVFLAKVQRQYLLLRKELLDKIA